MEREYRHIITASPFFFLLSAGRLFSMGGWSVRTPLSKTLGCVVSGGAQPYRCLSRRIAGGESESRCHPVSFQEVFLGWWCSFMERSLPVMMEGSAVILVPSVTPCLPLGLKDESRVATSPSSCTIYLLCWLYISSIPLSLAPLQNPPWTIITHVFQLFPVGILMDTKTVLKSRKFNFMIPHCVVLIFLTHEHFI